MTEKEKTEIFHEVETTTEKGTVGDKIDSNFYDIKRMIYYDLPVLVSKIIHAAFLNCQPGTSVIMPDDMKFIVPFIDELKKTFEIAIEGQTSEINTMVRINEEGGEDETD